MFALVLAALLVPPATPAPVPAPALEQLKTIAHLRATPFCTALREKVAPAIEHIMAADKAIDSSPPIFSTMYQDDVVFRSSAHMDFDVQHLEYLITPIVKNVRAAQGLLRDPQLGEIGRQLQSVVDRQNDALNIVNGFVTTYQMAQMQTGGLPDSWHDEFIVSARSANISRGAIAPILPLGAPGATMLYNAGLPSTPSNPKPPELRGATVNLGVDPYSEFSAGVMQLRKEGDAHEGAASLAIFAALDRCR